MTFPRCHARGQYGSARIRYVKTTSHGQTSSESMSDGLSTRTAPVRRPRLATRLAIGFTAGVAWGAYCWASLVVTAQAARDFTWPWRAARALLAGLDPYTVIRATGPYPFDAAFKYPLPAALIAVPFAALPPEVAAGVFIGLSALAFAWFLTRDDLSRWPLLIGGCMFSAVRSVQWTPLLAAGLLASRSSVGMGVIKPNLGAAMFAARPSWRGAAVATALLAIAVAVQPGWPAGWLHVLRSALEGHYRPPLAFGGILGFALLAPLLVAAALRWRDPDARLLLVLVCVPQAPLWYEALLATLVARSRREALALSIPSFIACAALGNFAPGAPGVGWAILLTVYVPALALVAMRPVPESSPRR